MITINVRRHPIPSTTTKKPFDFEIEMVNNDDQQPVQLRSDDFRVEVRPHPEFAATTREVHCGFVKTCLDEHFRKAVNEQGNYFTGRRITIAPKRVFSIKVSLRELAEHPFFKQTHKFNITLRIRETNREFTYLWEPLPAIPSWPVTPVVSNTQRTPPPVIAPRLENNLNNLKPKTPGESTMLEYEGVKPFYLNPTMNNSLRLRLSGNDQNQWIDISTTDFRLRQEAVVHIDLTLPPAFEKTLDASKLEKIKSAFLTTDVSKISVVKQDDNSLITLNVRRAEVVLKEDLEVELTVTLHQRGEEKTKGIPCKIPAVLQRPAFLGHAALDFGTTNSCCAYYDPDKGAPIFPDRNFSPLQLRALQDTVDSLMTRLEDQTQKDARYKILETRLIGFAQLMWARSQGGQVKSCADIRKRFESLKQQGVNEDDLGNWRAKLLVSWGIHGYDLLQKQQPEMAKFLAHQYNDCLNRIIDIDTQEDVKIFLPELERGRKESHGTLSSAILMEELKPRDTETNGKKDGEPYPPINPFTSKIKMGIGVDLAIKDSVINLSPMGNLPDSAEIHNAFITGTKRGIGQQEQVYFRDLKGQLFKDTYDPLVTAAIKHLCTLTEKSIAGDGSKCLNDLVVTYPTNLPQHRRLRLKEMVQSLGVRDIDLNFDEATAGALYHVWRELLTDVFAGLDGFLARSHVRKQTRNSPQTGQPEEVTLYFQNILFYDMGGGTTDIALLEIALEELQGLVVKTEHTKNMGRYFVVRPRILGLTGRDNFAGDNVTLAVFRILKSKLATKVANLLTGNQSHLKKADLSPSIKEALTAFSKFKEEHPQEDTLFTQWFAGAEGSKDYQKNVKKFVNDLIPTNFRDKPELQSVFFDMWNEAERIKRDLSAAPPGYEQAGLPKSVAATGERLLPAIQHLNLGLHEHELSDIQVLASEMEQVIRQDLQNTFEKARNLCIGQQENGQEPKVQYFIDRVILAGSSSHLRLIREEMPQDILSRPFKYRRPDGQETELPAPFKLDNRNLIFDAKESKLAVARGACLPRYFKTTRVSPQNPKLPGLLKNGVSFIDFDVDNLRHYVPFSLAYNVGANRQLLFLAGEIMTVKRRDGSIVARKSVAAEEFLRCYRIENLNQLSSQDEEGLYGQFDLHQAIAEVAGLKKDADKAKIEELGNQYLFFLEFDMERDLKCWMYFNPEGNADSRYVKQTVKPSDKVKPATVLEALCERNKEGDQWVWKANPILRYPVGLGKKEKVELQPSPKGTDLKCTVPMYQIGDKQGGIIHFETENGTPLWTVNLKDYAPKTPAEAKLRLSLKRQNDSVELEYTVYDPDLEERDPNKNKLREIQVSFDDRRKPRPFNPFGGEE